MISFYNVAFILTKKKKTETSVASVTYDQDAFLEFSVFEIQI